MEREGHPIVGIVTGGESGIGRATAIRLAQRGVAVHVMDLTVRRENDEQFAALSIQRIQGDVRRESDIAELVASAAQSGQIGMLVNNAGIGLVKPITEVTVEQWDACIDTNVKSAFLGCKHVIPRMKPHGGAIVNVSSNAGILPRAHDPVYSISKAAVLAVTKSLALCHSVNKIRVNAVCPGPVEDTGMMDADLSAAEDLEATRQKFIDASPLARAHGRMISPREVADAIVYLLSDEAAMVTGTALAIDGGKSLGVPPAI